MNSWAAISGLDRPSPASRPIWVSRAVSWAGVSVVRLRTRSPVARSSRAARSANPSAPMAASIWCAVRSCSGADAPVLPAKPLAVEEVDAGEMNGDPAPGELSGEYLQAGVVGEPVGKGGEGAGVPSGPDPETGELMADQETIR